MSSTVLAECEQVELNLWVATASSNSIVDNSIGCPARHMDMNDDDNESEPESESEDEFEDAQAYMDENRPLSTMRRFSTILRHSAGDWRQTNMCHKLNSILISAGVIVGIVFAYFQYRQQIWSNQMSALQTCATLEQSSSTIENSSFCSEVLHQRIIGRSLQMSDDQSAENTHGGWSVQWLWILGMTLLQVITLCLLEIMRMHTLTRRLLQQIDDLQDEAAFSPPIHVPNGIARLELTELSAKTECEESPMTLGDVTHGESANFSDSEMAEGPIGELDDSETAVHERLSDFETLAASGPNGDDHDEESDIEVLQQLDHSAGPYEVENAIIDHNVENYLSYADLMHWHRQNLGFARGEEELVDTTFDTHSEDVGRDVSDAERELLLSPNTTEDGLIRDEPQRRSHWVGSVRKHATELAIAQQLSHQPAADVTRRRCLQRTRIVPYASLESGYESDKDTKDIRQITKDSMNKGQRQRKPLHEKKNRTTASWISGTATGMVNDEGTDRKVVYRFRHNVATSIGTDNEAPRSRLAVVGRRVGSSWSECLTVL